MRRLTSPLVYLGRPLADLVECTLRHKHGLDLVDNVAKHDEEHEEALVDADRQQRVARDVLVPRQSCPPALATRHPPSKKNIPLSSHGRIAKSTARKSGGSTPWMMPGTGAGASRIQHVHASFAHSVPTLLSVPTNATGANQRMMRAMLPIHDVTYRKRVS